MPPDTTNDPNFQPIDGPPIFVPSPFTANDIDTDSGIGSSTGFNTDFDNAGSDLDTFTADDDPFSELFDQFIERSEETRKKEALEASTTAAREEATAQKTGQRRLAGLETLGVRRGLGKFAPELQQDRIAQAEANINLTLQDIDRREKLAIAEARQAQSDRDLDLLQTKLEEARNLRKEKRDALRKAEEFAFQKEKFRITEARLGGDGGGFGDEPSPLLQNVAQFIRDNLETASEEQLFTAIKDRVGNQLTNAEINALIDSDGELIGTGFEDVDIGGGEGVITNTFIEGLGNREFRKLARTVGVEGKARNASVAAVLDKVAQMRELGLTDDDILARAGI